MAARSCDGGSSPDGYAASAEMGWMEQKPMSVPQIFGVPISRSISNVWACLELGIDYEIVPIGWEDNSIYSDAFRAINPNARVPALRDDGFVLWESLAINLYLVRKHAGPIAAVGLEQEALAWQWTLWAAVQLERPLMRWAFNRFILPEVERNAAAADAAWAEAEPLLAVLESELGRRAFLAGDAFTVADLNVGCAMFRSHHRLDLSDRPNLARWVGAVFSRPAAERAWAIRVAETARLAGPANE
jgi:glutathione S-transferase